MCWWLPFALLGIYSPMTAGWIDEDTFSFWVPANTLTISKAEKDKDKDGKRWIQGIASTDRRDLQGEIVDQNGVDFSYFLRNGYFNDDHKPGPEHKVGQPTECRITKNGLWVKGFLFKNHERADKYWELMNSLKNSDSNRQVGFSIQGKVKRRDGNVIKECWIQDIALTPAPVNTATWAEVCKSLSTMKWDFSKSSEPEEEDEDAEKAQTAGGSPLAVESLEGEVKENRVSKGLTYEEAVEFYVTKHGLPRETAVAVADVVFDLF